MKNIALALFVFLTIQQISKAQPSRISPMFHYYNPQVSSFSWHVGYGYGAYSGDLSSFTDFALNNNTLNVNFSGGMTYRHTHYLSIRSELIRYTLRSGDKVKTRNFSFVSGNWELSSQIIYDIVPQYRIDKGGRVQPFIFLGAGLTWFEPTVSGGRNATRASKPSLPITAIVPGGIGIKFYLRRNIYLVLEAGGRFSFSDKLDGVTEEASTLFNDNYILYGAKLGWAQSYGKDYKDYKRQVRKKNK